MFKRILLIVSIYFSILTSVYAQTETVKLYQVTTKGLGPSIGTVILEDTQFGLLITPSLKGLTPGTHGFHIHQNPSCMPGEKDGKIIPALKAGGHFDPEKTNQHLGPYNPNGHLGDLPVLVVNENATATLPVLAPRLTLSEIHNRALMIHQDGDNYSDYPKALGGGGARVACGVIK
ncbi:superoxide dismutase family protein [Thiotrichales bacterium 19S11-10]|nr:superoxide dismutase family protein [Thiotrichales bacterium 19S11-10]